MGLAATLIVTLLSAPATALAEETPTPPTGGYELHLLKAPAGYTAAAALGINDAGTVVGLTRPTDKTQPQEAAIWQPGQTTATPLAQLEGSKFARAFDIGANGTIAGEAFNPNGDSLPVTWTPGITALASPNANGLGVAWDVANDGTVLATAHDGAKTVSYTSKGDGFTLLADPSGEQGQASGWRATSISDSGEFQAGVATIAVPHGDHTHDERILGIWHDDHVHLFEMDDESLYIDPKDINDSAAVVGATTANRVSSAAIWTKGKYAPLTDPAIDGFPHSAAHAINNSGVAVGAASKFAGNASFGGAAVAWFGTEAVNLNAVTGLPGGVTLLWASDINATGQIVGTAATPTGQMGFLLTPAGDPAPAPSPTSDPSAQPSATPTPAPSSASPTLSSTAPTPSASATSSTGTRAKPGLPKTGQLTA